MTEWKWVARSYNRGCLAGKGKRACGKEWVI